jgi:hypothetical protein
MDSAVIVNDDDNILGDLDHLLWLVFTLVHANLSICKAVYQNYIPRREPEVDQRDLSLLI